MSSRWATLIGKRRPVDRLHQGSVDRDQLAVEPAEIEMVARHRRGVDDPQQHLAAGLDLDHLRIGESAAVGEKRVIGHIVQVGRGRGRDLRRPHAGHGPFMPAGFAAAARVMPGHPSALFQIGENLARAG